MSNEVLTRTLSLILKGEILDHNLGDLHHEGQRVFNMGGIKRRDMPQLRGFPVQGSVAQFLPRDKKGKVGVSGAFTDWLQRHHGAVITEHQLEASKLRAAQNELIASRVAKHVDKMLKNPDHRKFRELYITAADGTLLDGHHGWASVRVYELLTGEERDLSVARVNMHIDQLLDLARTFTSAVGIEAKEGI